MYGMGYATALTGQGPVARVVYVNAAGHVHELSMARREVARAELDERPEQSQWEAGRADLRRCRMPGCPGHLHPLVPSSTSSAWCCVASAR